MIEDVTKKSGNTQTFAIFTRYTLYYRRLSKIYLPNICHLIAILLPFYYHTFAKASIIVSEMIKSSRKRLRLIVKLYIFAAPL